MTTQRTKQGVNTQPDRPDSATDAEFDCLIRRKVSDDRRLLWKVWWSLAAVSGVVAVGFWLLGAWPVLPFAGLELAGVALAFWIVDRRRSDFERITVRGDAVEVELAEGRRHRLERLNRHWVRVELAAGALVLREAGREIACARWLGPAERVQLAGALKELLRPAWR